MTTFGKRVARLARDARRDAMSDIAEIERRVYMDAFARCKPISIVPYDLAKAAAQVTPRHDVAQRAVVAIRKSK
jgi:hypothetical protein